MTPEPSGRNDPAYHQTDLSRLLLVAVAVAATFVLVGLAAIVGVLGLFTIASSTGGPGSPEPVETAVPATSLPPAVESVRFALVGQLRLDDPQAVRVISWEHVDWPNGCLGIEISDTACTEAIVPGYRVTLEVSGHGSYEFRTNLAGSVVFLASAPPTGIEHPVLVWESDGEDGRYCQSLTLAPNGEALVGPCGAPQAPLRLFDASERRVQFDQLLDRFASFSAQTPAGRIEFHGRGDEVAELAWQRAIAEWSRLAQQELEAGRSGASWGLALAWESPDVDPSRCRHLQLERYGYAFASVSNCGGGGPEDLGRAWMTTAELDQLYDWLDRLTPLESTAAGRLLVSSSGSQVAKPAELEAIADWAAALWQQLSERVDLAAAA